MPRGNHRGVSLKTAPMISEGHRPSLLTERAVEEQCNSKGDLRDFPGGHSSG